MGWTLGIHSTYHGMFFSDKEISTDKGRSPEGKKQQQNKGQVVFCFILLQ